MPLSITNSNKNNLDITNKAKPSAETFGDMDIEFGEPSTVFGQPGTAIVKETKNTLTITNEAKN